MKAWLAAAAFAFGCFTASAHAETFRLSYRAVVLGVVELGTAHYEVTNSASSYTANATLRTSGLARLFDQTDIAASSRGALAGAGMSWSSYTLNHAYGRKNRRISMERTGAGVTSQVTPRFGDMGVPPASAEQRARSYDPLSAVFALGRQVGAARNCRGSVLVFDGRQHYRLSVSPLARGRYNGGGYDGPAVQCNFRYEPIAGFGAEFDRSAVPVARAWFGLPEGAAFAPPLQLISPTPVGEGQLNLSGYARSN